jgi:ribosomal protein S18 acetylase RimI-like enzyme
MFEIRTTTKEDFHSLLIMLEKYYQYHSSLTKEKNCSFFSNIKKVLQKKIEEAIKNKDDYKILVAIRNNEIVGFTIGLIRNAPFYSPHQKIGFVCEMFVETEFRRKGIGKNLSLQLFKWFKRKEIKRIELDVDTKNLKAMKFWKRLAFSELKMRMKKTML